MRFCCPERAAAPNSEFGEALGAGAGEKFYANLAWPMATVRSSSASAPACSCRCWCGLAPEVAVGAGVVRRVRRRPAVREPLLTFPSPDEQIETSGDAVPQSEAGRRCTIIEAFIAGDGRYCGKTHARCQAGKCGLSPAVQVNAHLQNPFRPKMRLRTAGDRHPSPVRRAGCGRIFFDHSSDPSRPVRPRRRCQGAAGTGITAWPGCRGGGGFRERIAGSPRRLR